jgi:hypothetical protein
MAQSPQRGPVPRGGPVPKNLPPLRSQDDDYPVPATRQVITRGGGTLPLGGEEIETYPAPEPVKTIADEQRERSAYIESIGVEAYKAEVDNRTEEEKAGLQPQVEGAQYPERRRPPMITSEGTLA